MAPPAPSPARHNRPPRSRRTWRQHAARDYLALTSSHDTDQRLARVTWLADQASHSAIQPATRAAEACNLAALIASDCGMHSLARDLCWHQVSAFAQADIQDEATAKLALQPLVNLARLHIRDGDGDAGYQLLESL